MRFPKVLLKEGICACKRQRSEHGVPVIRRNNADWMGGEGAQPVVSVHL